ncbi:hypothetical protein E3U55_12085 [Filobacillus milosensis]|uniref:Uncharacterized protein n=1 Tax=Filobacillus milosensis TaxID=94137 RepID=A0A4Y8IF45_9BACI|nr:hypothetical protein [Filobacillus milosensis]TFB18524.1 hypothetical protein E3U55_12085 [Filobacillus milosensis]
MASCCSIDINNYFDSIIIGEDYFSLSMAFHSISFGMKTALVVKKDLDIAIMKFLERFDSYIERDTTMPKSLEDTKEDFHLSLFEDNKLTIKQNGISIEKKEIEGNIIIINEQYAVNFKNDYFEGGFFYKDKIIKIQPEFWLSYFSNDDEQKEIWDASEYFVKKLIVKN